MIQQGCCETDIFTEWEFGHDNLKRSFVTLGFYTYPSSKILMPINMQIAVNELERSDKLTCAFIQVSTEASMPYKEINIDRAFLLLEYQYGEWRNECYQRRNSSSFIFVSFLRNLRQSDIIFFVLVFHKSSYLYPSFLEKKKKTFKVFL